MRGYRATARRAALPLLLLSGGGGTPKPTYYVDAVAGNDTNDGLTPATAWQSIGKVNAATLVPGDYIAFKGGQTFSGALVIPASGDADSRIIFGSYGSGRATISSGTSIGVSATNRSYIIVQNLIVAGNGTTNTTDGVYFVNDQAGDTKLPGIQLFNLDVSGYGANGILLYGNNGSSGFASPEILSCTAHDNTFGIRPSSGGTAGIKINSQLSYGLGWTAPAHTSPLIDACTAYNNTGKAASSGHTGSGILMGESVNGTISDCVAYNNGGSSTSAAGPVGIWYYDCDACTITRCKSYSNLTGAGTNDGGGFDMDGGCRNCVIEYCYSQDNYGPGYMVYSFSGIPATIGGVVRYCISQNDGSGSIDMFGIKVVSDVTGQTDIKVYNNTVYNNRSGRACIYIAPTGTYGFKLSNNIMYSDHAAGYCVLTGATSSAPALFQGNCYYGINTNKVRWNNVNYTTIPAWQAVQTAQEKVSGSSVAVTSNPLLTMPGGGTTGSADAYRLQAGSTLKGVGLNLNTLNGWTLPISDYFGNTIPTATGTGYNVGGDGSA